MERDGQIAGIGPQSRTAALRLVLQAPDSYGLVLALLILSFLLAPLATGLAWLWIRVLIQGATVVFALHTSRVRPRALMAAITIVGISVALALAAVLSGGNEHVVGQVEVLL